MKDSVTYLPVLKQKWRHPEPERQVKNEGPAQKKAGLKDLLLEIGT